MPGCIATNRSRPRPRGVHTLAAAAALSLLSACGSSTTSTTVTPPTTLATPPPPSVVAQGSVAIPLDFVAGTFFATDRAGTLDATVDYTFADSRMVVWIARGRCTADQFGAEQCDFAATSFTGPKPRRVSVTGAAPGNYTLIIGNGGPRDESISMQVVLTPTVAAAPVRSESASSLAPVSWTAPMRTR
jgi:hypothetical protein